MSKVYVLFRVWAERDEMLGVFATYEAAVACADERQRKRPDDWPAPFTIEEYEVQE